jgi:hypothetical protein
MPDTPLTVTRFVDEVHRLLPGATVSFNVPLDRSNKWKIKVAHSFGSMRVLWCGKEEVFKFGLGKEDVASPGLAAWKTCGKIVLAITVSDSIMLCMSILTIMIGFFGGGVAAIFHGVSWWYVPAVIITGSVGLLLTVRRSHKVATKRFDATMGRNKFT